MFPPSRAPSSPWFAPADYGVDEKAQEMLSKLPEQTQQVVLQKLNEGLSAGKVKNASAYVVGICNGPDVLGVDEKAAKLLDELPKQLRTEVLEKLRRATDVRNPSAWVAKAVLQAKQNSALALAGPMYPGQMGPQGGGGFGLHGGGGYGGGGSYGGGGGMGGGQAFGMQLGIDAPARQLLMSLPQATQQEIMTKLLAQSGVRNPSAWIAKAAMQAGASASSQSTMVNTLPRMGPPPGPHGGHGAQSAGLDPQATALLASLPQATQQEIQNKLLNSLKAGNVMNPSAWVAKACLKAGATSTPGAGKPSAFGRVSPY